MEEKRREEDITALLEKLSISPLGPESMNENVKRKIERILASYGYTSFLELLQEIHELGLDCEQHSIEKIMQATYLYKTVYSTT